MNAASTNSREFDLRARKSVVQQNVCVRGESACGLTVLLHCGRLWRHEHTHPAGHTISSFVHCSVYANTHQFLYAQSTLT